MREGALRETGDRNFYLVMGIMISMVMIPMFTVMYLTYHEANARFELLRENGCVEYAIDNYSGEITNVTNYPCVITGETK